MMVGRWYVQLAALWHWYLPLCIYITFFNFILYLSIPFFFLFSSFKKKPDIDKLDGMVDDTSVS